MQKNIEIAVCNFCHNEHLKYSIDGQGFLAHMKYATHKCLLCGGGMCQSCVEHSMQKTDATDVAERGVVLCHDCIETHRYTKKRQEILSTIENAKAQARQAILDFFQKNEHNSNATHEPILTDNDVSIVQKQIQKTLCR